MHQLLTINKLARSRQASIHIHSHGLQAVEAALRHAGREVAVLGVGGCFFEGAEVIFAFVVFFFAAVVEAVGAVAAVVGSSVSVGEEEG